MFLPAWAVVKAAAVRGAARNESTPHSPPLEAEKLTSPMTRMVARKAGLSSSWFSLLGVAAGAWAAAESVEVSAGWLSVIET